MEEKLRGIVINGISLGENDKLLNIFTLEKGVISAKIKGVKKAGAKLKFASEPFCFSEYTFSVTADRRTVTGASLIDSFYPVRENIVKFFACGTVVEYVKKFLQEGIVSETAFSLVVNTLKEIAYGDSSTLVQTVKFLYHALDLSGFAISEENCLKCQGEIEGRIFFDYNNGAFICEKCYDGEGREISITTYHTLKKIIKNQEVLEENALKVLKLLDFYMDIKAEVKLNSLKELLKMIN